MEGDADAIGPEGEEVAEGPARGSRRMQWGMAAAATMAGAAVLLAMAPVVASCAWVRSAVLARINRRIDGRLQVDDWVVRWRGVMLRGVHVYHDGKQILGIQRLVLPAPLWEAIRGRSIDLGHARAEGVDFIFRNYADGGNNFERLAGGRGRAGHLGTLPEIRGNLAGDFRGRIEVEQDDGPTHVIAVAGAARLDLASQASWRLKDLSICGDLHFNRVEYAGMEGGDLELPVDLSGGRLRTIHADRSGEERFAPPGRLAGGRLDLSGLDLDFLAEHPALTDLRPHHRVLEHVAIGPKFMRQVLGGLHPLFAGSDHARGVIDLTVDELKGLALDDSLVRPGPKGSGRAAFRVSLARLALSNPMIELLASQLRMSLNADGTLPGSIRDGSLRIEDGCVFSDLDLRLGGQTLEFRRGQIRLDDGRIVSLLMIVPRAMVPGLRGQEFLNRFIEVPVHGTVGNPDFDVAVAAMNLINPLRGLNLPF